MEASVSPAWRICALVMTPCWRAANAIQVEAEEIKKTIKQQIDEALKRMATVDAEKAAWSAPGVTSVKSYITVWAAA